MTATDEDRTEKAGAALPNQPQEPEPTPSESGPPTYRITTVRDFLAVPEDRIDACLHDFSIFLRSAPHWAALLGHVSDEMHGPGVVTFLPGERFDWIDDGDHNMTLAVIVGDEQSDVITLTPDDAAAITRNLAEAPR